MKARYEMDNTVEIIDRGIKCLSKHLGEDEAELFITTVLRERFDYTEWRRLLIDEINDFDDLDRFRAVYGEPVFKGNPKSVI